MSNKLKLTIVATTLFTICVVATTLFNRSDLTDPVLAPRQKKIQTITIKAKDTPLSPTKKPTPNVNYYILKKQMQDFQWVVKNEVEQKFIEGNLKDESSESKRNNLNSKISLYFKNKDPWYKANINIDEDYQIVIYYKFLTSKPTEQVQKIGNISFRADLYIYYKGKWSTDIANTNLDQLIWNNNEPYFVVNLSQNMEGFARDTENLLIMVPIPSESGVLYFLKYQDNELAWDEGPKFNWTLSSQDEAWEFQKEKYKVIKWTPVYLQP